MRQCTIYDAKILKYCCLNCTLAYDILSYGRKARIWLMKAYRLQEVTRRRKENGSIDGFLGAGEVATALGGVVTALLDKLEHAVGWCANHDTPSRTAVDTYIAEIQIATRIHWLKLH